MSRAEVHQALRRSPSMGRWAFGAITVSTLTWRATQDLQRVALPVLACLYLVGAVRYPEANLLLYYIIGKVGFEERLALMWGISLNQVFQAVLLVSLVMAVGRRGSLRQFPRVTTGTLVLLTVFMTAGLARSDNVEYGLNKVLAYVLLVVPGIAYLGCQLDRHERVQRFLHIFFLVAAAMMLVGLRSLGSLEQGNRLAVLGGGANVYSRMVGTGLLLLATLVLEFKRVGHSGISRLLALTLAPGFVVAMYYAGSKGPMLSLLLSFLLFSYLNRFLRRVLLILSVAVGLFVVAAHESQEFKGAVELVSASRLFLNPSEEISYGSYGSRLDYYRYSAQRIAEHPVLGVGTGAWGSERKVVEERAYPHNLFVELACEYGLLLPLVVLGYFVWLARGARRLLVSAQSTETYVYCSGLVACLAFWFLNVQVSGDIVDTRNLWVFAALLEISLRLRGNPRVSSRDSEGPEERS